MIFSSSPHRARENKTTKKNVLKREISIMTNLFTFLALFFVINDMTNWTQLTQRKLNFRFLRHDQNL